MWTNTMWRQALWKSQYLKDSLSEDLHNQVRSAPPGAKLGYCLRSNLNQLDEGERKEVVSVKQDGCAPLFIACKKGNLDIVEYLLQTCGAEVEQRGHKVDDNTSHCATPLWCASVTGNLPIVKCLVKHGANVNSVSDTGCTPVLGACSKTHFDVVQYLVEVATADINIPNFTGRTALMSSVTSAPLCEYLVAHGAHVNAQDIELKTALHHAIQYTRLDTTKLLLENGACPFLKNRHGDDALQTACVEGDTSIFNFLLDFIPQITRERRAEVHELMGSTFVEYDDVQMALYFWRKAVSIRYDYEPHLPKPPLGYSPMYANILDNEGNDIEIFEFKTRHELEIIANEGDEMRMNINSLLIAERILGAAHKDVILRIMYRGIAEDEDGNYFFSVFLWRYALQLRIMKDSILDNVTSCTAFGLTYLYLRLDSNGDIDRNSPTHPLRVSDLIAIFQLLTQQLSIYSEIVRIRPVHEGQQQSYDSCLRCWTHLLALLLRAPNKTVEQTVNLRKATNMLLRHNLRRCSTGDTLLHMAVDRSNTVFGNFWQDDELYPFPSIEVAVFLIDCGADVNAVNEHRSLPLHCVVSSDDFDRNLAELLLDHGSHVDQLDNQNTNPLVRLQSRPGFSALGISLKCTSARIVCNFNIPFKEEDLPRELIRFVELHRPTRTLPMMMADLEINHIE